MAVNPRQTLIDSLRGREVRLPNLWEYFPGWPAATSKDLPAIRHLVNHHLDTLYTTELLGRKKAKAFQLNDFPLFGAAWWPDAPLDRLLVTTAFFIWIYAWDDELDNAKGDLCGDFDKAQQFRSQTVDFLRDCLDLPPYTSGMPTFPLITLLQPSVRLISEAYSLAQRRRLLDEMLFYIDKTSLEHRLIISNEIPTLDDYWGIRMGTSAIHVTTAMLEYAYGLELSEDIARSSFMRDLFDITNEVISLTNDILSVKKEAADGAVHNALIILFAELGDLDAAVASAMALLRRLTAQFEVVAERLLQSVETMSTAEQQSVRTIIKGCQYQCTGNLAWSLSTPRYGVVQTGEGRLLLQL
ncbi:hypothetical protein BAUCODRAFT_78588 [Baudoinia panamericana UAMH 10762]|uniref:Terpene synthase n=1 Tax=Baudoinia panamericana (strain UAMH 10762) TaxID=717646 RepID=M2LEN3_BAUPA|nr:uncharacterized protein BAUCODRAFT_78588 [Baudoinia panamericana UAMH 10762]EMC92457.1 hypothetical protein BAUCODRAFT_78588 [Baudoinia panamericana UAMH 10762]